MCVLHCLLQGVQGFLDKSDGRDKLLATVQYAAMFLSAGQPGDIKRIQVSVATARKVFRVMKASHTEMKELGWGCELCSNEEVP